jgi:hypothetical protein
MMLSSRKLENAAWFWRVVSYVELRSGWRGGYAFDAPQPVYITTPSLFPRLIALPSARREKLIAPELEHLAWEVVR